jgi:precorrin-6A/cobalt-precorrin-6A reductase
MILLLGGTSESDPIAHALADRKKAVLVSTATDLPLTLRSHALIRRHHGVLSTESMIHLAKQEGITAIVDATHPYATEITLSASHVAKRLGLAYFRFERHSALASTGSVLLADDHPQASRMAFSFEKPVLLTIGTRNIEPYCQQAKAHGIPVFIRALDHPTSRRAWMSAGVHPDHVLLGQGPFSVEENQTVIRRFSIGVLVTKDSGHAGGAPQKLHAAEEEGCRVVVVKRPGDKTASAYHEIDDLVSAVSSALP